MSVKVRVPATTANLGSGFDTIGMALQLYNRFTFSQEGKAGEFTEDNLVYKAAKYLWDYVGETIADFTFTIDAEVPIARGLGSSATCIIAGMMGANELLNRPLEEREILTLATALEGHPDNVAPALYGGCIFSSMEDQEIMLYRVNDLNQLKCYVAIPDFEISTKRARQVLPEHLSYEQAVYNMSRMPFLLKGLHQADIQALKLGTRDKLHQPYRKKLIHGYDQMLKIEDEIEGSMVISGAGPTLLFLTDTTHREAEVCKLWKEISEQTDHQWKVQALNIDETGVIIE